MDSVILQLEEDSKILLEWVSNNVLKVNPDKFHLLLSNPNPHISVKVDQYEISNSNCEKLLGIIIDNKLIFNNHVAGLCKKRLVKNFMLLLGFLNMNMNKRRTIMKAFIIAKFGYCPLVWMFHSRTLNNRNKQNPRESSTHCI